MAKPSNREKILTEGLRVVHARGFSGASVRDIVQAAGVPQGSFTNHFASKEAFGLEIIDLYFDGSRELMGATLLNEALPPLRRLEAFIDAGKAGVDGREVRHGCLLGNFSADTCEQSEPIRHRLVEVFEEMRQAIATCLRAAVAAGEVADLDCDDVAGFILSSLQGASLFAKTEHGAAPIERFKRVLLGLLRRDRGPAPTANCQSIPTVSLKN